MSNPFCHRTTRGGRKHTGKRRKLERSKGVVNILLTSDFDATLISETHFRKEGLLTAVTEAKKSGWAGTGSAATNTVNNGTSAGVLTLVRKRWFSKPLSICSDDAGILCPNSRLAGRVIRVMGREILLLTAYFEHSVGFRSDTSDAARLECTFEGRKPRCSFGQEIAETACSQYANAVGTLEESDELGHALETWSDATAQYWASSGRVGQLTLSGKFAKFRMRPVLGETFMPLGCVILEGGGNAELRAWKAFGQWINIIRKALPVTDPPEHARCAARKIVNFIQGSDTLSMKVMDDLSTTERWSLVEESTLLVLSFLKREGSGAQCYMLTERVRRLADVQHTKQRSASTSTLSKT